MFAWMFDGRRLVGGDAGYGMVMLYTILIALLMFIFGRRRV